MLTEAEARESEAREEAGKHAKAKEEVGRLLERTASEVRVVKEAVVGGGRGVLVSVVVWP